MADLPTRLDLQRVGANWVLQRNQRIDPRQVLVSGSDANLFVGSGAAVASAVVAQLAYSTARLLLDGAVGEDLDRLAFDRYRLPRKGAAPAVVDVRMYRASAAAGAGSVPIGTPLATAQGIAYTTTETVTFGASALSATGACRAAQAGKSQQVGKNAIRQFQQPGLLFDKTLKVNNDEAAAGGEDVEADDDFRARVRAFWASARRGVAGAIEFGALLVPGVASAQAQEALTSGGLPARYVALYIADSSGIANAALARAVQIQLLDYRAAGIYVQVYPSLPTIVPVRLSLAFASNVDTNSLTELVRAAVVEYVNSLPVNGTLAIGGLASVLERYRSDGLIPSQGSIVTPVGDVVPDPGASLRTTLDDVTVA
jgi:uncharacterized phage protein gp47/JayE